MSINTSYMPTQKIFAQRRKNLLKKIPNNSIVFLATNKVARRNNDADYKFRTDSSFFYLTGFIEPESALVLSKDNEGKSSYILFCREKDTLKELWDGKRAGLEGAVDDFEADESIAIADIDKAMPELLLNKTTVYCRFTDKNHNNSLFAESMPVWIAKTMQNRTPPQQHTQIEINNLLDELRLIKSADEIKLMRLASEISVKAHKRAMKNVKVGMMEYALEAELIYVMKQYNCDVAYTSIVAGGDNACILHYIENNQPLKSGDLVLIDAGAEYQNYASDITRTFPVNGKFSEPQKEIYNIVLESQIEAMKHLKVGKGAKDYHHVAVETIVVGLLELGLLKGDVASVMKERHYLDFFMHGTGHWLGLDVHDVGNYMSQKEQLSDTKKSEHRPLQAGMVLTVEPGIYISPNNMNVPEKYRGIGIRIEDDVLITEGEPEILTQDLPKTISEIEAFMAE